MQHDSNQQITGVLPPAEAPRSNAFGFLRIFILLVLLGVCLYYLNKADDSEKALAGPEAPKAEPRSFKDTVVSAFARLTGMPDPTVLAQEQAVRIKELKALHKEKQAQQQQKPDPTEDADSMLQLATALRDAGVKLKGVSQCRYTQYQREAFGGHDSPARKVLESIYTECRTRDQCAGIRGYPTWTLSDKQWPGNRSLAALREVLAEARMLNPQPMLQGPSEPRIEEIPDAQHNEVTGDAELTEADIQMFLARLKKDAAGNKFADAIAALQSSKNAVTHTDVQKALVSGATPAPGGSAAASSAGFPPDEPKKENVRGVANYPPLNVMDMPGTQPFVLQQEHHEDQTRQGNVPRLSMELPKPTAEVAQLHVETFVPENTHVLTRDPNGSQFSKKRYPHSADITTGEGLSDKVVYNEKN